MFLKSVLMGFLSFHSVDTTMLKECENHADIISGCVEREYHSNGKIYWETPFKNGGREGIERWYYENGNLEGEIPYKNGKREGTAKGYDKLGNLQIEMSFLNDMPQGDTRFYTTDKKLLALLKVENGEFISGKCFNDKALTNKDLAEMNKAGHEKAYKYLQEICLKESDSNSTLHADTLKECKTKADKISGCVVKEYYENGNLEFETPYKNDKIEGIKKSYDENGNLEIETPYKNDKREGMTKLYYSNGKLWEEAPYKNGKVEGIAKVYFENGKIMAEMSYLNNLFHGDTRFYTEDGKLLALVKGENGEIISGKCFDDKVLTDKEREDLRRPKSVEEAINYLKEICSK